MPACRNPMGALRNGRFIAPALLALALVIVGFIVSPGTSTASHAAGGQGHDFVVGVSPNEVLLGEAHSAFAAQSDPFGGNPSGHVVTRGDPDGPGPIEPFMAEGDITCLRVDGNRAAYKWRFRRAEGSLSAFEGGGIQAFLEDNGPPQNGTAVDATTVDPPQLAPVFNAAAAQCDDPNSRLTHEPINYGNFVVRDAV
jgi:hypothetical protein